MLLNTPKVITNNWKNKAIDRKKIISKLNKKIKELEDSRSNWKEKYKVLKMKLKSSHFEGINDSPFDKNTKAKRHHFCISLVVFFVQTLSYGKQSLRGCVYTLLIANLTFKLGFKKLPCHTTVRNWACKMGYFRTLSANKSNEKWVIFVDESISIGCEKILLVLGIPTSKLHFNSGLTLSEMRVLSMQVSLSWKAEDIDKILQKVHQNYPIDYIVSDCGNNLKACYKLGNYLHIPDCMHIIANILSSLYEKEESFIQFCKTCGELRRRWSLSKNVDFMPPSQRGKVRFANLFGIIEWAKKHLDNWSSLPENIQKEFLFLEENKVWIEEFYLIQTQSSALQKILKIEGYDEEASKKIEKILSENHQDAYKKQILFKEKIMEYLKLLCEKKPKEQQKLYCSSDIIESAFGKLKQKINPNSTRKMTIFILTLASISGEYSEEEVKKGLENIREKDLKNYRNPPEKSSKSGGENQ